MSQFLFNQIWAIFGQIVKQNAVLKYDLILNMGSVIHDYKDIDLFDLFAE